MSTDIIYNRAFIKVDNERVIPIIEAGSSNCYEASGRNPKRARSWCNDCGFANYRDGFVIGNEALKKAIDDFRQERINSANEYVKEHGESWAYDDGNFGYHTGIRFYGKKKCTFTMFKNFYLNGIKQAKTIEEYRELGIHFNIHVNSWDKKAEFADKGIEYKEAVTFISTEHMLSTIKEFVDYYEPYGISLYIGESGLNWNKKKLKQPKVKKAKTCKVVNEVFVLESDCGYFIKQLRWGYRYSYFTSYNAKKFETEKQANAFHKRMKNKDNFKVRKLIGETTIWV